MSILHIDSSARLEGSNSRAVSRYVVEQLQAASGNDAVIRRDLVTEPLPQLAAADLMGVHGSLDAGERPELAAQLALSEQLVDELVRADTIVFGVAMYNFALPFYLKQWVDYVCRAGVTFRYTEQGPVGLTGVERAFIVTASGGTSVGGASDFASTYLEHICRFLGIETVHHIDASGSKRNTEQVVAEAKQQVDKLF